MVYGLNPVVGSPWNISPVLLTGLQVCVCKVGGLNPVVGSPWNISPVLGVGECLSIAPFLEKNRPRPHKGPRSIVCKEWNDTRTFAYIKSTH